MLQMSWCSRKEEWADRLAQTGGDRSTTHTPGVYKASKHQLTAFSQGLYLSFALLHLRGTSGTYFTPLVAPTLHGLIMHNDQVPLPPQPVVQTEETGSRSSMCRSVEQMRSNYCLPKERLHVGAWKDPDQMMLLVMGEDTLSPEPTRSCRRYQRGTRRRKRRKRMKGATTW